MQLNQCIALICQVSLTRDLRDQVSTNAATAIPGLYLALIMQPGFTSQRVQSLRFVGFGSTVISPETLVDAAKPAKLGTVKLAVGFGMSEVLPVLGTHPDHKLKAQGGCLGLDMLAPGARVRICEHGSCKVLERGEVGELHIGGEGVIKRYMYGDNAVFYDDDWGHWIVSGDQAKMEVDGTFYILGRYKDIIIRAGENLSPALIETCLNRAGVMVTTELALSQ